MWSSDCSSDSNDSNAIRELLSTCDVDSTNKPINRFLFTGCERSVSTRAQPTVGTGEEASVNVTSSVPTGLSETSIPSRPDAGLSQCEFYHDEPPPRPFPDLVHDPLLQVSPKISIPKKQGAVFRAKHIAESTGSNVSRWS